IQPCLADSPEKAANAFSLIDWPFWEAHQVRRLAQRFNLLSSNQTALWSVKDSEISCPHENQPGTSLRAKSSNRGPGLARSIISRTTSGFSLWRPRGASIQLRRL